MSQHVPHVAFRSSKPLYTASQAYIELMSKPGSKPDPALLGEVMNHFTRDSLDAFMLGPMEQLGITGTQRKLVEFAADTVQKSSQMVLKAVLHKLDHDQHRKSAEYMDQMRLLLPHGGDDGVWFVSFPAPVDFAARARATMARARVEGQQAAVKDTVVVMKTLTDLALQNYYEKPLAILRFGPILGKITSVAIATVRKGTHSTIESLMPKLSEEQFLGGVEYFDSLLTDVPRDRLRFPVA